MMAFKKIKFELNEQKILWLMKKNLKFIYKSYK